MSVAPSVNRNRNRTTKQVAQPQPYDEVVKMAHGLPDYYRGIDIAYQSLVQMTVKPVYGPAKAKRGSLVVTANEWNQLLIVGGKGIVYGGYVHLHPESLQKNSVVYVEIDGELLASKSFYILYNNSLDQLTSCPIYLLKYDNIEGIYAVGFAYGLTFESSVLVKYQEAHGATPTVNFNLIYAKI